MKTSLTAPVKTATWSCLIFLVSYVIFIGLQEKDLKDIGSNFKNQGENAGWIVSYILFPAPPSLSLYHLSSSPWSPLDTEESVLQLTITFQVLSACFFGIGNPLWVLLIMMLHPDKMF